MPVVSSRISDDLHEKLKDLAAYEHVSMSDCIRKILEEAVDRSLHPENSRGNLNRVAFTLLEQQITAKDAQIEALHQQADQLQKLLAMNAKTVDSLTSELKAIRLEDKRSFWKRLFGQG